MWSTPSSTARRSTARAPSGSRGGPNTPGPASCIAPKPMRLMGLSPRNEVLFMPTACTSIRRATRSLVILGATPPVCVRARLLPVVAGDQPRPAPMGGEAERPADQHKQPVLEADQIEQVHCQPGDPCDEAAEMDPLDVGDRARATDRRKVSLVEV